MKNKNPLKTFARLSGAGIQMGLTVFLFNYTGVKLDEYFSLENEVCMKVFTLLGVFLSIYVLIRATKKLQD